VRDPSTPELPELHPTPTRLALLADVDDKNVADEDGIPMLDLGDGTTTRVADAIWEMNRAGWVWQPPDILGWRITNIGRAVLKAGAP
jgi:hypothetical protein